MKEAQDPPSRDTVNSSRKKAGFDLHASARCSISANLSWSSSGSSRHSSLHLFRHLSLVRGAQMVSYPSPRASARARRTDVSSPRSFSCERRSRSS